MEPTKQNRKCDYCHKEFPLDILYVVPKKVYKYRITQLYLCPDCIEQCKIERDHTKESD